MNSFLFEEIITCGICLEMFNGDSRCPRILTCGHSFCHSCLEKLIEQNPRCHTCNRGFRFKKVVSIPINFSLKRFTNRPIKTEEIILALQEGETIESVPIHFPLKSLTNIKTEAVGSPSTIKSVRALDLQEGDTFELDNCAAKRQRTNGMSLLSKGHCEVHDTYVGMRCMDCKLWICGMCAALQHKYCRTLVVEEAYIELKKQLSLKVQTKLGEWKETFIRLDESLRILDDERKSLIEEIRHKERKLEDCEKRVREVESKKSEGRKFCQKLEELHGALNVLEKLLEDQKSEIPDDIPYLPLPLSKKQLENWCSTESVYAEDDRFDGIKYGKVTVKDGRILVHNFQSEKPEGRLIPFKEILSKFDGSPPEFPNTLNTAFLRSNELSNFDATPELPNTAFLRVTPTAGDAKCFDILIKTDGTSPRAKNFILLCSALKGPTYKGKVMNAAKLPDIVPQVNCFHLLQSLAPVTVGIIKNDTRVSVKKGGVYGTSENDSWFFISWNDCPSRSGCVVGDVVAGLHELSEQKEHTLTISDCGLVIGFL